MQSQSSTCVLQVYLQCALLYTTTDGRRIVRISTLALPVTDQMGTVFKGADLDSQLVYIARQVMLYHVAGYDGSLLSQQSGVPAGTAVE